MITVNHLSKDFGGQLALDDVSMEIHKGDKIVVVGGDKELGTTKITAQVAQVLAQMPEVVKSLTGADIHEFLKKKLSPDAKDAKK